MKFAWLFRGRFPPPTTGRIIRGKTPNCQLRRTTNGDEDNWTHSNDKWHQNASATLLPWYDFVSFVDDPSISVVTPANQQLINPFIGVHSCPFVVRRSPSWTTFLAFADNAQLIQTRKAEPQFMTFRGFPCRNASTFSTTPSLRSSTPSGVMSAQWGVRTTCSQARRG